MEFDITKIDKKLLIRTLFTHAAPIGLGKVEYDVRDRWGENVEALTDDECDLYLYEFNDSKIFSTAFGILDYLKGKPMKLNFYKNKIGRVVVDSCSYDARNGKYRFLEAMLNTFPLEEIQITKKGYRQFVMSSLPNHLIRSKEQETMFKTLIKNTNHISGEFGKYWNFDESKVSYIPFFMR